MPKRKSPPKNPVKVAKMPVSQQTAEQWHRDITPTLKAELDQWRAKNPLRLWRESVGKSQSALAALMTRNRQQVEQWESGLIETPRGLRQYLIPTTALMELHLLGCTVQIGAWAVWWRDKPKDARVLVDLRLRQPIE